MEEPAPPRLVLAFDVGGTSVKAALVDADLDVLDEVSLPSEPGAAILDVIVAAAQQLLEAADPSARSRVEAVGVAMPGLVDAARGRSIRSVNLDLHDLDVASPLTDRLGLPVSVGHDVGAAGLAVHRAGMAGDDAFVVVMGTGVASVALVDGKPILGASGQAGELGHIVVRPGGRSCACGRRGCLEAYAGAHAIVASYRQASGEQVDGVAEILARLDSDPAAAEAWREAVSALADALLTACAVLAPQSIVIAGGVSEARSRLADPLVAEMRSRAGVLTVPPVRIADLGRRAGTYGAALLALDSLAPDEAPSHPRAAL